MSERVAGRKPGQTAAKEAEPRDKSPPTALTLHHLLRVLPPLRNALPPASCPGPAHSQTPRLPSLFVLPEHVVLFALHVLEVKVGPGHALVDVLDVVARGLEVGCGVVGPRGEDLDKTKMETKISDGQNQTSPASEILASKETVGRKTTF